jgi:subtilisin family serine protease
LSAPASGRPPVIALLDTGVAPNQWFIDDYLTVSDRMQAAVGQNSGASGLGPATIFGPDDGPMTNEPLLGGLASHFGHGTFIAGLMRQIAPQARVKAVRIMHSDGVAYESDLICALQAVAQETHRARLGEPDADHIDVVSLSLGYFAESIDTISPGVIAQIDQLTAMGIIVVCAAGNYATSRPFLPAALYSRYQRPDLAPLISVGALNPNGSVAMFSDEASWVHYFAPGAAMVSTFPVTARGSRQPDYSVAAGHRQGLDQDDFSAGFAVWSGTSFATGAAAARIAAELARGSALDPALSLDREDVPSAVARAAAAIAAVDSAA